MTDLIIAAGGAYLYSKWRETNQMMILSDTQLAVAAGALVGYYFGMRAGLLGFTSIMAGTYLIQPLSQGVKNMTPTKDKNPGPGFSTETVAQFNNNPNTWSTYTKLLN
jgi:hypothetical protein